MSIGKLRKCVHILNGLEHGQLYALSCAPIWLWVYLDSSLYKPACATFDPPTHWGTISDNDGKFS